MYRDFTRYELIGRPVSISDAKNKSLIGLKGRVIDETKNTLVIETNKGVKKVIKKGTIFKFMFNAKENNKINLKVKGDLLVNKPEDRINNIRK